MRFITFLNEEIIDAEDWGSVGKKFEDTFSAACKLVGLKFQKNTKTGKSWDIHPTGDGWERLYSEKDVNIKVAGTKWMFGSSDLTKILPWENKPEDFDVEKAAKKVKRVVNKLGIPDVVFLKPKDKDIQQKITDAVRAKDIEALDKLMVKKNFNAEKLGRGYTVRVLTNNERVTSIAIDKGGKVFMRSEKPRKIGGSMMVTFRTPTAKIGKIDRKVKT
jgi:hypothetical protein